MICNWFSNSRSVQRACPSGGLEQAKAISLASFSPSKMRGTAGVARCLRLKTASKLSHQLLAHPVEHRRAGIQRRDNLAVAPVWPGLQDIGLQQNTGLQQPPRGAFALRISASSCWRSSALNRTTYFFAEISFPAIIASLAKSGEANESQISFKLVEADD